MTKVGLRALYDREVAIRPPAVMAEGARQRQEDLDAAFLDGGRVREELVVWRTTCPVCGGSSLSHHGKANNWPMALCSGCGGVTVEALPTTAAWSNYYANSRAEQIFQQKLFEGTKHKRFATIDEPRARWVNERCQKKAGKRVLLDIGCSSGAFLEAMQPQPDWECHGIDANPEAVKIAREKGLSNVVCAQLEEKLPEGRFDAVTFWSVLAQLDDPRRSLVHMRESIVPGGRVFLADVNFDGFYAAVVGLDHASYVPPIHKNYFTATTIVTMLEAAGFTDVEVETPGYLDLVRVWMYWERGGRNGYNAALHKMIAHEMETDSASLQQLIVDSRASEHMWVTARRA